MRAQLPRKLNWREEKKIEFGPDPCLNIVREGVEREAGLGEEEDVENGQGSRSRYVYG